MGSKRVVVLGAGIAGTASAWFLAQHQDCEVLLIEKEAQAGVHSSGRNAAILRTAIPDPVLHALARDSMRFYRQPPAGFSETPLIDPVGLFLSADTAGAAQFSFWIAETDHRCGGQQVDPAVLYQHWPQLAPEIEHCWWFPDEGVFDVDAILTAFLRGARAAGAEIRFRTEAVALQVTSGGRLSGVQLTAADGSQEVHPCDAVLAAGGGWASAVPSAAACPLPLQPIRRHLLVSGRLPEIDPRLPVVWIAGDEFYFRPESGGLLMSACDTQCVPAEQGEELDPEVLERIAAKAEHWLPGFPLLEAAHAWAGMRTFAPDHRFVIGPDPRLSGLYWLAALGGHGITCGPAAARLACEWILTDWSAHPSAPALLPDRLL